MEVRIDQSSPVSAKVKISVPSAQVRERLNAYFASLARQVRMPGFRPGKAPAHLVKQKYKEEAAADVSERLISEFTVMALKERNLDLVSAPVLVATDLPKEDQDFKFEVEVDLKPQVPEIKLDGLSIESDSDAEVTDEDVEAELNSMREKEASFKDVTEKRAIKDRDCVVISFEGELDGQKPENMKAESHTLVLGENQFLPDFEKALMGMSVGEEKTFPVGFPADYQSQDLQGKTASFHTKVLGIKEKVLPPLDDEFAKSIDEKVQGLTELKAKIKEQLAAHKKRVQRQDLKEKIGDLLVEKHPFDVSPRQVERFAQNLAEQTHHMMHQMGVQHEENEENMKSLVQASMKKAERDVRLSYILEKIAKDQKIEVEKEDFEKRFLETAEKTGLSVSQIKSYYAGKDEDSSISRSERLRIDILDEKSLDYALSQATIKMKGPSKG